MSDVKRVTLAEVNAEIYASKTIIGSCDKSFLDRPAQMRKIAITTLPTGNAVDGFRTHIRLLNQASNDVETALLDETRKLLKDFMEGRAALSCFGNGNMTLVKIGDSMVDVEANKNLPGSGFGVFDSYVPLGFMDELANFVATNYSVDVAIVEGKGGGLVLRRK